ncbi:MAG: hypothetical protein HQM09_08870 [Candidatus Riflebacteria bacterium]|nr:hypothetical protein [Candidatus Riflebacteria bacterium]
MFKQRNRFMLSVEARRDVPVATKFNVLRYNNATIALLFILTLGLFGCGGGGGGGGGTPVGPDTSPPATMPELAAPTNGYQSAGIPVSGTALTVKKFLSNQSDELVFFNRTGARMTINVAAQLSGALAASRVVSGNTVAKPDSSVVIPPIDISHSTRLHQVLRDNEKLMPPFSPNASRRGSVIAARKADNVGDTVNFRVLMGTDLTQLGTVNATCRSVTSLSGSGDANLNIYLDTSLVYDTTAKNFISQLAQAWPTIYNKVRATFGEEPPADFNSLGKDISVVLSPALEIAGFFNSGDLFPPDQIEGGKSNQRKIFYMQYAPANSQIRLTVADTESTMAHEFQHMINFYQRNSRGLKEDDWLNEAMSGYSEHICGFTMTTNNISKALQVQKFFNRTPDVDLTLSPWPGTLDHEHYGQVYLFGVWLGEKYGIDGSLRNLVSGNFVGKSGIAAISNKLFDAVVAEWMIALVVNDQTKGAKYGYEDIDLYTTYTYDASVTGNGKSQQIQFSGPSRFTNNAVLPFSGAISIDSWSGAYLKIGGGNGSDLVLSLPSQVSVFEMHK